MATKDLEILIKLMETDDNSLQNCQTISEDIKAGKTKFLQIVEGLESELVSTEVNRRLRGVEIIATVLNLLPRDHLSSDEISHVTTFLCVKLKDHHSLIPTILRGLFAIVQKKHLPSPCIQLLTNNLSTEVQNHLQTPEDRRVIYSILEILIRDRLPDLQQLGTAFVFAVIRLVDAECNARNLQKVFSMLPPVLANCELKHLAEDFFEVLACYFPIEVPTTGNEVVSRENLVTLLERCLTATPEIAAFVFPLLLEKLETELKIAKLDSLSLLVRGCDSGVWGASELAEHWRNIAYALHRETQAAAPESEVYHSCLKAATAVTKAISASALSKEQANLLKDFTNLISDLCEHPLKQVELKGFLPASRMAHAVALGSHSASRFICERLVPLLAYQAQARASNAHEVATLLVAITCLLSSLPTKSQDLEGLSCSALYFEAANAGQDPEVRQQAFAGLTTIASVLTLVERIALYRLLEVALVTPNVSVAACCCLCALVQMYPEEILKAELFKGLFQHKDEKCKLAIDALCVMASEASVLAKVAPRLLELASSSDTAVEQRLHSVRGLQKLADTSPTSSSLLSCDLQASQVMLKFWISLPTLHSEHITALQETGLLISTLQRNQSEQFQETIIQECWPLLGLNEIAQGKNIFNTTQKAVLSLGLLGSLKPTINLPGSEADLVDNLITAALGSTEETIRDSCGWLAACILNKSSRDIHSIQLLDQINATLSEENRHSGLILAMRLARSLLLRGHKDLDAWMSKIISWLEDPELSTMTGESFSLLVEEENKFLNTCNHATVRLLHGQRLSIYIPQLLAAHSKSSVSGPLMALTQLLRVVPDQALKPLLPEVVPALVGSVKQDTPVPALRAALDCLGPLLENLSPAVASYLTDLALPCLKISSSGIEMKVRMAALKCVGDIAAYGADSLVSLKPEVLDGLKSSLDDRKRLVRQQAVKAAGRWHLLGASGGS